MNLPALTNFPTLRAVCVELDKSGDARPLRIRRSIWSDPLYWIFYSRGLWFVDEAAGVRLAKNTDMTVEDFLAQDWTTLTPACLTAGGNDCEETTDFFIQGFYYDEVVRDDSATYENPNAGPCGDVCDLPELPASLSYGEQSNFATDAGASSASGVDGSGSGTDGGGGSGSGTSGGGFGGFGSASGSGSSKRKRRRRRIPNAAVLTLTDPITNVPACVPRLADESGRLCDLPANPQDYTIASSTVSLADTANPADVWFVKVFWLNELVFDGTLVDGETKDVTINGASILRWGQSHALRAIGWHSGRPDIHDQKLITMPDPCEPDVNCGELYCAIPYVTLEVRWKNTALGHTADELFITLERASSAWLNSEGLPPESCRWLDDEASGDPYLLESTAGTALLSDSSQSWEYDGAEPTYAVLGDYFSSSDPSGDNDVYIVLVE